MRERIQISRYLLKKMPLKWQTNFGRQQRCSNSKMYRFIQTNMGTCALLCLVSITKFICTRFYCHVNYLDETIRRQ